MRFSATPPSIRMWYSLMLMMVGETSSGSYLTPAMLLGQSEASKLIDISIHLWCGTAFGAGVATATSQHRIFMMRREVLSQESMNMMDNILRCSLSLDSESEWPYTALRSLLAFWNPNLSSLSSSGSSFCLSSRWREGASSLCCRFSSSWYYSMSFLISLHYSVLWRVELCTGQCVPLSSLLDA
jgi:hypothetical protein